MNSTETEDAVLVGRAFLAELHRLDQRILEVRLEIELEIEEFRLEFGIEALASSEKS